MRTPQHKSQAFNLIESTIVLGVVGLVIGGIWVAAASFYESYKINKTIEGILSIARNTQRLVTYQQSLSGGNTDFLDMLIATNSIPESWVQNNTVYAPINSELDRIFNNNTPQRFLVRFIGVKREHCIALTVKMSSIESASDNSSTWVQNRSGLGQVYAGALDEAHRINQTSFPVSPQTAATYCEYESNTMVFGFGYTRIN